MKTTSYEKYSDFELETLILVIAATLCSLNNNMHMGRGVGMGGMGGMP